MDVFEAIKTRKSVRDFTDKKVEWEKITAIIEAGVEAPSAGNIQPWYFIILDEIREKQALFEACYNQAWVKNASHVIVVVADIEKSEHYYPGKGRDYAIQSCSACIENMLLAAHAMGLGCVWIGAFDEERVADIISLPKHLEIVALIAVGYPSQQAIQEPKRPRIEPKDKTYYHKYLMGYKKVWKVWHEYTVDVEKAHEELKEKIKRLLSKLRKKPIEKPTQDLYNHVIDVLETKGKEKIKRLGLKREKGYLYFIDSDGDVSRIAAGRKAKKEKKE